MRKLGLALTVVGLCACGGGAGGGGGGDVQPITNLEDFYDAYLDELCDRALQCEAKSPFYGFTELLACHPGAFDSLLDEALARVQASIDAGRIQWNQAAAEACLDAIRSMESCTSDLSEAVERGCAELIQGMVLAGESCVEDVECVRGTRCQLDAECPGTCVALAGSGDACDDDEECASDLRCGIDGTCETYSPPEECRDAGECESGICSNGLCAPLLREGEACEPQSFGGSGCAGNLVCVGGSDTTDGACGVGDPEGAACGDFDPCSVGLRCANTVCVRLVGPGGACESALECPVGFSCDGTCNPLPMAGQACSATETCLEGVCDGGVCRLLTVGEPCEGGEIDILSFRECAGWCETDDVTGDQTCAPVGGIGAACDSDNQCGESLECVEDPDTFDGTCQEQCGW